MIPFLPFKFYVWSTFINFVVNTLLGCLILWKFNQLKVQRYCAYFCLCGGCWSWFYFCWIRQSDPIMADFYLRTLMIPIFFLPGIFFQFIYHFLGLKKRFWIIPLNYALAFLGTTVLYTPLYAYGIHPMFTHTWFWLRGGPFFSIFLTHFGVIFAYSFYVLLKALKHAEGVYKAQIRLVLTAIVLAVLCGSTNYPAWYLVPLPPITTFVVSFYGLIFTYAIMKYRIIDIQVIIRKGLIYTIVASSISVLYLVAVYLLERTFHNILGYQSVMGSVGGLFIIAILFTPLKEYVQSFVDRYFFKASYIQVVEQNVQLKKLDQLKDDFISLVSHELRTPLTVVRESISQMEEGLLGEVNEKQKKYLNKSLTSIDGLITMINDLLDISKMEKGKFEIFKEKMDIVELMEEVVFNFTPQTQKKGLEIKFSVPHKKIYVLADKQKIIQVMMNLMGNAFKFTQKGSIEISVIEEEAGIKCSVSDTGIGIASKDLPRLFSKFDQIGRQFGPGMKGTGLGLVIAKEIVERHGGKIQVESVVQKGTKFIFTLPKYDIPEEECSNLKLYLTEEMKKYNCFSLIGFKIIGLSKEPNEVLVRLSSDIKKRLFRQSDEVVLERDGVYIVLADTEKENAGLVAQRIIKEDNKLEKLRNLKELDFHIVNYPKDGRTEDELLVKLAMH